MQNLKAVILGAGRSTRLNSAKSKILHSILGREVVNIVIDRLMAAGIAARDISLVINREIEADIAGIIPPQLPTFIQETLDGTASALKSVRSGLECYDGDILIVPADAVLFGEEDLAGLSGFHRESGSSFTILSAFFNEQPLPPFGRIIKAPSGMVLEIVEAREASSEVLEIREMNSAIYLARSKDLWMHLDKIGNRNSKGEYYLTDLVAIFNANSLPVRSWVAGESEAAFGVNTRADLEYASGRLSARLKALARDRSGVTFHDPATVTLEFGVEIGRDSEIYPFCYLGSGTRIGRNCRIGPFCYLRKAAIPDGTVLETYTRIENRS